jgi:hypothetical protein
MDVRSRVLLWRAALLLRGANRRRRARLRRELASYTGHQLVDLECAIERYPLGQTHEVRSLVADLRLRRACTQRSRVA